MAYDWWAQNHPNQPQMDNTTAVAPGDATVQATTDTTQAADTATGAPATAAAAPTYSFQIPPGFDPNNPVDKLVLDQFEAAKKAGKTDAGSQPTADNMNYWRTQINNTGGATTGNLAYWNTRMSAGAQAGANQYGTGDFAQKPDLFVAPTGLTEANDPGYQARLKMGTDALQGAAAAKGSILSGGTLKALDRYSQDYASNEFGNVYGRALTGYNTNVGTQRTAMNDYWSRLQGLTAAGQQTTAATNAPVSG